jgi:hypothetical protein
MSPTHLLYAQMLPYGCYTSHGSGMKMVRIFSDCIRDRIRLEGFRSIHIRVQIFDIRYCICIRILKLHIYDVDIQSYPIRQSWYSIIFNHIQAYLWCRYSIIFESESGLKYENKCNISNIHSYPIYFNPCMDHLHFYNKPNPPYKLQPLHESLPQL